MNEDSCGCETRTPLVARKMSHNKPPPEIVADLSAPLPLALSTAAASVLVGCSGWQSALDPKGEEAEHIAWIIWLFTFVCTAVWVLVMLALAIALLRRRGE